MRWINSNETWRSLILVSAARELMQADSATRAFCTCGHSATNYRWGYCFQNQLATAVTGEGECLFCRCNDFSLASWCLCLGFLWAESQPSGHERYSSSLFSNHKKLPLPLGPGSDLSGFIPPSVGSLTSGPYSSKPGRFGTQIKAFSLFLFLLWEVGLVWHHNTSPVFILFCQFRYGIAHTSVPL